MHETLNSIIVGGRQQSARPEGRVVDQPVYRSELLAHPFSQVVNARDIGEIESPEVKRPISFGLNLAHRRSEGLALFPCDSDNNIASRCELARNRKPQAAAAAGYNDISHSS